GEIAAKNDLEVKKRALAQIIGRPAPSLLTVGPNLTLVDPQPNNMEAWVTEALATNLDISVSRAVFDFATQEVERNRAAHLPTVDAFATYTDSGTGAGATNNLGVDTTNKIIGLQLAVPIYQGGLVTSRVREALANQEKARQDLENARRTADFSARQAFL